MFDYFLFIDFLFSLPLQAAVPAESSTPAATGSTAVGPLTLVNDSGKYELIAVLTHKGRSADSGHYIAWVKQEDGMITLYCPPHSYSSFSHSNSCYFADKWLKYDDEKVSIVNNEEITKLNGKGGGMFFVVFVSFICLQLTPFI